MSAIIYTATNLINNKKYVGFTTKSFHIRINGHFNKVKIGSKYHFHNALRKYGRENFRFDIIYQSKYHDHCLNIMEPHFISEYNTTIRSIGYNMTPGGDGNLGFNHSEETKLKISKSKKGKSNGPHSKETKLKIGMGNKGKTVTKETRHKLSIANLGKTQSIETRQKMSQSSKGRIHSLVSKQKMSKSKIVHIMPSKQELGDMLTMFYQYEIGELYNCSQRTVCRWKSDLKL